MARTHLQAGGGGWKPRFLEAYQQLGTVTHAAARAGVARSTVYAAIDADPTFSADWREARESAIEGLERVAIQRAVDGSDTLLIFLLKSLRPERYRDNVKIEHTGELTLNDLLFPNALGDEESDL